MDGDVEQERAKDEDGQRFRQPDFGDALGPGGEGEAVTMAGLASLVQQQLAPMTSVVEDLRKRITKVDTTVANLATSLTSRLEDVETSLTSTDIRVEKCEAPIGKVSERNTPTMDDIEVKIREYLQLAATHGTFKQGPVANKRTVTAVFGSLTCFDTLEIATACLKDQLRLPNAPPSTKVYSKGAFKGLIFPEFGDVSSRNRAVDPLQDTGLTRLDKRMCRRRTAHTSTSVIHHFTC
ncbi:unnamed protein product [Prorocentrum cordatum]|uniref:Uncharacterized protein n=1 Tax=Prorocentrum cordatum TaxID=2364126 RepID=A0ABN9U4Z6_9DINO|nr:unnamed protein product [Polarella glacialis]